MKKTRIIAFLLALLMTLPLLAACGGGGDEKPTKPSGSAILDDDDPLKEFSEDLDFGGEEVVISLSKFTSPQITSESFLFIQGPDKVTTDTVLNKIYDRNILIADSVGVEPIYVFTNLGWDKIMPDIQQKTMSPGKNTPDLYIDQVVGMLRAQMAGLLVNVLSESETSHINFEEGGWYNDYMKAFNFSSDEKQYLLAGDYFMDVIRFLNTMGCNLDLFTQLFYQQNGTDLLYKTVLEGNWTLDTLMEWSEIAHSDKTGTKPGENDEKDQLGLLALSLPGPGSYGWYPSVDVNLYSVDKDGSFYVPATNPRAVTAIDKMIKMAHQTNGALFDSKMDANGVRSIFINGTVLFTSGVLLCDLETDEFQNMEDDKCVIPYPKLEATDPYLTTTHDNARVGGILKTTQHYEALSAWLQAAALTSTDILNEYYNVSLKFKYGTNINTTKMLDIIYDSICAPYWITTTAITDINMPVQNSPLHFENTIKTVTNTFTSGYSAIANKGGLLESSLKDFMKTFNALSDK